MVYVDIEIEWPWQPNWPFGKVSHMYADRPEQLHEMAKKLGLKRKWCSDHTHAHSELLHYDLSPGKRKQALANGVKYDRNGFFKKAILNRASIAEKRRKAKEKKQKKEL